MSCCRGRDDLWTSLDSREGEENCLEFHNDIRTRGLPAENIPMITTLQCFVEIGMTFQILED